jgi:hypothetical protein|tara:strand:- start:433 stop:867 length:435 start_codon:yes stop_codon:yes gene_type:complete
MQRPFGERDAKKRLGFHTSLNVADISGTLTTERSKSSSERHSSHVLQEPSTVARRGHQILISWFLWRSHSGQTIGAGRVQSAAYPVIGSIPTELYEALPSDPEVHPRPTNKVEWMSATTLIGHDPPWRRQVTPDNLAATQVAPT